MEMDGLGKKKKKQKTKRKGARNRESEDPDRVLEEGISNDRKSPHQNGGGEGVPHCRRNNFGMTTTQVLGGGISCRDYPVRDPPHVNNQPNLVKWGGKSRSTTD